MATYGHTFTSGDTLTPTKLNDARTATDIVNADIKSDAAIAGTKIAPDFGSQNVVTTGEIVSGATSVPLVGGLQGLVSTQRTGSVGYSAVRWTNNAFSPFVSLAKSRGTSIGSNAIVQNGDQLGIIEFAGDDGTDLVSVGAQILASVDGTPGANDMPGRLEFRTTADGDSSPTERMRIDSAGRVGIGTTPNNAAILDLSSNSRGFLPPRMGTTQRNAISSPVAGLIVYNTSTNKLNFYNGTAWEAVTSA
jgi:hypothetical protein